MNYPKVVISKQGAAYLSRGQRWMYRNNLVAVSDECAKCPYASIVDEDGSFYGAGFYNAESYIPVRILSLNPDQIFDEAFFQRRIQSAWNYRRVTERANLSNCRIIFGDADFLPGLTVDRYDDVLVSQITTAGMERIRDRIYPILLETLRADGEKVSGIFERNDVKARTKEGLQLYKGPWNHACLKTKQVIDENGLKLYVDIENGQKTGYFLDQKRNRLLIREMASGLRVLDCFTHTGGFALNAAKGNALLARGVDVSKAALDEAAANAELNGLTNVSFVQADVFDYLDQIKPGDFDLILLDPPAFTKDRRTVNRAYQGYKRINMQAMKLLRNGGYLATCSCSRYMETDLFEQMLKEASLQAQVYLRQISVTQQNSDHPVLWTMEETSYLKFFLFQVCAKD